jgi:DNA mismatch repair protein MutS2
LDEALLDRARTLAGEQKTAMENLISTFEKQTQELEDELYEARKAREKAEEEQQRHEEKRRKLEKEREEFRQQALEEAERIVEDANARIEQTIKEIKEAQAEKEATKEAREKLDEYKEDLAENREEAEEVASAPVEEEDQPETPDETNGQPKGDPDAPIHEGDRVLVDDGSTEMEVQEVDDGEAVVIMGSMHMRVELDRLTRVGGPKREEEEPQPTTSGDSTMAALKASPSIDVRGQRVDEARQNVQHFLDDAIAAGLDTVEILHGKGTGALRESLHDLLRERSDITDYGKAPIEEGGAGVTKVTLS